MSRTVFKIAPKYGLPLHDLLHTMVVTFCLLLLLSSSSRQAVMFVRAGDSTTIPYIKSSLSTGNMRTTRLRNDTHPFWSLSSSSPSSSIRNSVVVPQASPPNCTNHNNQHNRLECFLWNLQVEIPQQSFKKDYITITVHDMICANFFIQGLDSRYEPSSTFTHHHHQQQLLLQPSLSSSTLTVSVAHVAATCQGRYHSTGGLSGDVQAYVVEQEEQVKGESALQVVLSFDSATVTNTDTDKKPKQPAACHTKSCNTLLNCQRIHFSGSISAKLIQAFSKTISHYITDALQTYICPQVIQKQLDPLVTHFLQHPFHDFVKKYIPSNNIDDTQKEHKMPSQASKSNIQNRNNNSNQTNVADYSIIHWMLSVFNQQLQSHLQKGWIPLPNDDGLLQSTSTGGDNEKKQLPEDCQDMFRGFSGWVKSIFGTRPRIRLPHYFQRIVVPIHLPNIFGSSGGDSNDNNGDNDVIITVNMTQFSIEGLDQMDQLQALKPKNDTETDDGDLLQSSLSSKTGFFIVAPVTLNITFPNKEPLIETFHVTVNLTQVEMSLESVLQVTNWDTTSLLQVVNAIEHFIDGDHHGHKRDWHALACLFQTLQKVEVQNWMISLLVNSIQLTRDRHQVPDGSLEADLYATINTVLQLALQEYEELWTLLVKGLVRGPGTRTLNAFIRTWIAGHSVPSEEKCISQCPSPCLTNNYTFQQPKWVNFTKFEILNKFNRFLGHSKQKRTLNHFLKCTGQSLELWNNDFSGSDIEYGINKAIFQASNVLYSPSGFLNSMSGRQGIFLEGHDAMVLIDKSIQSNHDMPKFFKIKTLHWDSLDQLQVLEPSGETSLKSSLIYGGAGEVSDTRGYLQPSLPVSVSSSSGAGPQVTLVIEVDGPKVSGQVNLTVIGSMELHTEVQVMYDLNRLENLTISHLLQEGDCALLPAMEMRLLPGSTRVTLGKYFGLDLTALINDRHVQIDISKEYPDLYEVSNQVLEWSLEWARSVVNKGFVEWMELSLKRCPGVVFPSESDGEDGGGSSRSSFSWKSNPALYMLFLFLVAMQFGLLWIAKLPDHDEWVELSDESSARRSSIRSFTDDGLLSSRAESMRTCFQELISGTPSKNRTEGLENSTPGSLDRSIFNDLYEDIDDEEPQVILEEQLFHPVEEESRPAEKSLFASKNIPEIVRYVIPAMVLGTLIILFCSNTTVGASVDVTIRFGTQVFPVPGLFQFSLGNTVSELYHAGIYPLLMLVVCFSGIWPYAKLFWMLWAWMKPYEDPYKRERRLLTLDALGKFSLIDTYVLILFVVAFRFHLEVSESLGIDVFVTPVYGFFSFLLATCLSLLLGHAALFFHRRSMKRENSESNSSCRESILDHAFESQNGGSPKRFAYVVQITLLSTMLSALLLLVHGFSQEFFTFQFGGMAGVAIGDDFKCATYSVLSLGLALPQCVNDSQSFGIMLLQCVYFFYTVMTPVLCLTLLIILMVCPLTIRWQRALLVTAEIANAWGAIEVFLLSVLAAVLQISTFASFMVGDRCKEINHLAEKIFDDDGTTLDCFTVDASVESSCWYLIVGALLNSWVVSFALRFTHAAVEERSARLSSQHEQIFLLQSHRGDNHGWTMVQQLMDFPLIGNFLFFPVPDLASVSEQVVPLLEDHDSE